MELDMKKQKKEAKQKEEERLDLLLIKEVQSWDSLKYALIESAENHSHLFLGYRLSDAQTFYNPNLNVYLKVFGS
jgi:hypothetical protein